MFLLFRKDDYGKKGQRPESEISQGIIKIVPGIVEFTKWTEVLKEGK